MLLKLSTPRPFIKAFFVTGVLIVISNLEMNAQSTRASLDSIVQQAVVRDKFEGSILVAEDGVVQYHEAFGFVDAEQKLTVDKNMHFGIASVTKLFTAIIILQLVEEGSLSLDANLKSLLPDLNIPKAQQITVHHLLLHISGLPNEIDAIYQSSVSPLEFVQATLKNPRNSLNQFNYANIDYVLLGLIIEKLDGTSWHDAVEKRILNKLGMTDTGFLAQNAYPTNFAHSFSYDRHQQRLPDPHFYIENFYAAGCMYSTAEDLLQLDQALYDSTLLSEESKQRMFTSYPEYNYSGYSVWTYNYPFAKNQPKVMERRGSILGANVVLVRLLDSHRTLLILSNNNRFNSDSFGNPEHLKEALIIHLANNDFKP